MAKKTINQIIVEIKKLLKELESRINLNNKRIKDNGVYSKDVKSVKRNSIGCIGFVETLISDGYFNSLRTSNNVMNKLEEEGQPYSRPTISMNLLNLVRKKILRRIKKDGQWQYIVRK